MIFNYLLLLLSALAVSLTAAPSEDRDPIVVKLETEGRLLPLYAAHWIDEQSGFERSYLEQLEKVLRFDLGHNGATALLPYQGECDGLANRGAFDSLGSPADWQSRKVYYVVKARAAAKKLSIRLLGVNAQEVKAIDNISLTGILAQDRRTIHQIADTLHRQLFGKDGVASTRFLYTVKTKGSGANQWLSEVWEADYDGANARQITRGSGYCVTPTYLPSAKGKTGSHFLYVSYLNGQPKIFLAALKDGIGKRLTLMRGNQLMPAVSRQCDKIAFISDITGNPDLFMQPFSPESGTIGKPQQLFSAFKSTQGTPSFSPNGKQIAFVSNKDGAPRIYIIEIAAPGASLKDVKPRLITKLNRENSAPAWSPDGSKLAYCAMAGGTRQIWYYDFDKKEERQLTQGQGNKENPTWGPDSLHLIYNSTGAAGSELYLINLNQSEAHKISSGIGEKRFPSWGN